MRAIVELEVERRAARRPDAAMTETRIAMETENARAELAAGALAAARDALGESRAREMEALAHAARLRGTTTKAL